MQLQIDLLTIIPQTPTSYNIRTKIQTQKERAASAWKPAYKSNDLIRRLTFKLPTDWLFE